MTAKRHLGQHFLSDPNLLEKIAAAVDPRPDDVVLEIGPGRGSLTRVLAARVGRLVAIEKDRGLAAALQAEYGAASVTVVVGDALRVDWHAVAGDRFKVVGNIPYNITTPLIDKALTPPWPERVVFLVQAEVADRLAAAPGSKTYGALSVGVQATCRVERLFGVAPGAFRPPPRVHSALVRLTPLAAPLVAAADAAALRRFVTACFGRRRKQLKNAVAGAIGRAPADTATLLEAAGIDPTARPETLAPVEFARLLRQAGRL